MDLSWLAFINLDLDFLSSLLSIIIINLILSGDNAVVIALAVRSLPHEQRKKSIIIGSGGAVILRIALTFFAIQLLQMPYLKIVGGILIAWIAVKLFLDDSDDCEFNKEVNGFLPALRIILIADLVMSLDNVLAVAAASNGNLYLLIFGLAMSIPIVVGTSTFLLKLMDKFPVLIAIGAAVLGKVAGEMIVTDPVVVEIFHPSKIVSHAVEVSFLIGVIVFGKLLVRRKNRREEAALSLDSNDKR